MAQVDFYLCKDEKLELAEKIFEMGLKVIAARHYESPRPSYVLNVEDFIPYATSNTLMFIVNAGLNNESIVFDSFLKNGKQVFYIRQRYGFVSVDLYSPGLIEPEEHLVGQGFL